jgi:porin
MLWTVFDDGVAVNWKLTERGQRLDSQAACPYDTGVSCITKRGWTTLMAIAGLWFAAGVWSSEETTSHDEITVRGTILQGRVLEQATNGVRFETVYGSGEILIPYGDIEQLRIDGEGQPLRTKEPSMTAGDEVHVQDVSLTSSAASGSTNLAARADMSKDGQPLGAASPDSVESQVESTLLIQQSFLEREYDLLGLPTYYSAQQWLDRKLGLRLGLAYTALALGATDSVSGKQGAAGGDFDFFGRWETWGKKSGNTGTIGFNMRHRHKYTDIPPSLLGSSIGSLWNVTGGFNDAGLEFTQLYLDQYFLEKNVGFRIGQMFQDSVFNTYSYKSWKQYFVNAAFSDNPAVAFPRYGVGFASLIRPAEGWYILTGVGDSTGRKLVAGPPDFLASERFFSGAELGWRPVSGPLTHHSFALFGWHTPTNSDSTTPDGEGISLNYEWQSSKPYGLFAQYSWSGTEATRVEHLATAGMVWQGPLGRELDLFGVAGGFGSATESGVDGQGILEIFYRLQVTPLFQITPDVQLIIQPSLNPQQDVIAVFGIRGRVAL